MKPKILIASFLVTLGIFGGYFFPFTKPLSTGQALPQVVALFETSLASPISTSATSMTLTANAVRGGGVLSGFNCFTVDEGSAQAEFICGTVSGTTVSSLTRGIDPATGTSTVASLKFAHRRGANVKITDFPTITIIRNQLSGIESISSSSPIKYDSSFTPTLGSYVVAPWDYIKTYADGLSFAGVATSTEGVNGGLVWLGTSLQQASSTNGGANQPFVMQTRYATDTPTSGCAVGYTGTAGAGCSVIATLTGKIKHTFLDIFSTVNTWTGANTFTATTTISGPLYGGNRYVDYLASTTISGATTPVAVFIATSTNAVWATNASNATTSDFLGFVRQNVTNGATTSVQIDGVVGGFTGLTAGKEYYASTTGVLSTVYDNGTAEIYVGRAISSTQLLLDRKGDSWQYLGSVSGTTVSFPLFARFAVTNPTLTFTNCGGGFSGTYSAQLVVYKIGMTSASAYGASSCSGGTTPSNASVSASVSGTTLTITSSTNGTASLGNTTYFYR